VSDTKEHYRFSRTREADTEFEQVPAMTWLQRQLTFERVLGVLREAAGIPSRERVGGGREEGSAIGRPYAGPTPWPKAS
jgi:hypothetical protein